MKITFFIQNISRPAGSERVTSILANELVKLGYKVSIISICGNKTSFYPLDETIQLHVLINKESVNNKKVCLNVLMGLIKYYKMSKPDLVIDIFASLSIYSIMLKKIFGFKNLTWEHFNYKVNTGMNKFGRKLAVRFSNQIITLTETDKRFYESENQIHGSIDYIYNPSPYQNVRLDQERMPYVISVGRLTHQKGFDRLIEIWKIVEGRCNWELLIFGEGEDKETLQRQIDKLGLKRVKLVGTVKNIDQYYKQASLYVSTARYEGLPMTMIEAQSFGLPIVTFDYDTGPGEIVDNGINGLIISRNDENVMIQNCALAILEMINNKHTLESFSKEALVAAKRFRVNEIMEKWIKVLDKLSVR